MLEIIKERPLTIAQKADKKGFVKRAQGRGYAKNGTKRRYPTEEEGFDGCGMESMLQEKE